MESLKKIIGNLYWTTLILLVIFAISIKIFEASGWIKIFHLVAYYLPAVGMLSVSSGQIDLLSSMQQGGMVNLKARIYDFIHWLMLIGINIGVWMIGGVTILWFILKLLLLVIIGWQIGVGLKRRLRLFVSERNAGIVFAIMAFSFGIIAGCIRNIDNAPLGWGWIFECSSAIIATLIVIKWIWHDMQTISQKARGYPRTFFLKGVFSNFLIVLFWIHIMTEKGSLNDGIWWLRNLGLSFNVILGNVIYLIYWLMYEYYRDEQERCI